MRRQWTRFFILAIALSLFVPACERDTAGLAPARPLTDPLVFQDNFGNGVTYEAFLGSKLDAIEIVTDEKTEGAASLKVIVPRSGDSGGGFAGGACPTGPARYLVEYNALTFWAAASVATSFDVVGFGNDNTGTSKYTAESNGLALTEAWQKFVVPIPLSGKLVNEAGMFFFADGSENGAAINVWFDDIRFENVPTISNPRPSMTNRSVGTFVGARVEMRDTRTTFNVTGTDQVVSHMPSYFTFFSSDEQVAKPVEGAVQVVGPGSATITAKLDQVDVVGTVTLNAQDAPTTPAAAPTLPQESVISMFSNAYNDVPIDTWLTDWSRDFADLTDFQIAGDDVKAYTNLIFAGVEFVNPTIDAASMTHFHIDVWLSAGSSLLKLKFVDFGDDGEFGGTGPNADSESEITFSISGSPPLPIGSWVGLDVSLDSLMRVVPESPPGLRSRSHLAQLIISGTRNTVFVDNLYYYR